jgi:hypothetical protein
VEKQRRRSEAEGRPSHRSAAPPPSGCATLAPFGRDAGRCRSEVDVKEPLLTVQEKEAVKAVEAEHHNALEEVAVEVWDIAVLMPRNSGARRAYATPMPREELGTRCRAQSTASRQEDEVAHTTDDDVATEEL